jgi:hypothetical protein
MQSCRPAAQVEREVEPCEHHLRPASSAVEIDPALQLAK